MSNSEDKSEGIFYNDVFLFNTSNIELLDNQQVVELWKNTSQHKINLSLMNWYLVLGKIDINTNVTALMLYSIEIVRNGNEKTSFGYPSLNNKIICQRKQDFIYSETGFVRNEPIQYRDTVDFGGVKTLFPGDRIYLKIECNLNVSLLGDFMFKYELSNN